MARESKECVREKILTAAEKRFWHYGIKKTTIDEIAADAEVGKGTVYLHFDSKEEIAIAIIGQYKEQILIDQERVAKDGNIPVLERLKRVLSLPIECAYQRVKSSPMVLEMVSAVRPQFPTRRKDLLEREIAIVAELIVEGNDTGVMHVAEPQEAARLLKQLTHNQMTNCYGAECVGDVTRDIEGIVDFIYQGLR